MLRRLALAGVLAGILALSFALPVVAGNWATATLDESVDESRTGEPISVGFTLMRHGVTPFSGSTSYIEATNTTTGEVLRFGATVEGDPGHWMAELTLPSAGMWDWVVKNDELMIESDFAPISVIGTGANAATAAGGVTPAELQTALDTQATTFDKQLANLTAQIDGLETQVATLESERETLQKQVGNLEAAVSTPQSSTNDDTGMTWWLAALAGAAGAMIAGLVGVAVARWRGLTFDRDAPVVATAR